MSHHLRGLRGEEDVRRMSQDSTVLPGMGVRACGDYFVLRKALSPIGSWRARETVAFGSSARCRLDILPRRCVLMSEARDDQCWRLPPRSSSSFCRTCFSRANECGPASALRVRPNFPSIRNHRRRTRSPYFRLDGSQKRTTQRLPRIASITIIVFLFSSLPLFLSFLVCLVSPDCRRRCAMHTRSLLPFFLIHFTSFFFFFLRLRGGTTSPRAPFYPVSFTVSFLILLPMLLAMPTHGSLLPL